MYNPFSLDGKTIFITGASSGIGKAVAIECSRMGANVIITGRNVERLAETYSLLEGSNHKQIIADLCNDDAIKILIDNLPTLNGIVHCAGITDHKPPQFINQKNLTEIFNINFFSPALITNALIKNKKIAREGSIVFLASTSGVYGSFITGSSYSATKGAIAGLAKGLALDLAPKKIRVNSVCPAMINTNIFAGRIVEEQLIEDAKKYPLKRYGEPEEVAYAVIYLLSDASKWITGTNLLMDGGLTLN